MKNLYEFEDWEYLLLPIADQPSDDHKINSFYRLWKSKIVLGNKLPYKADFQFEDFKGLHGWVAIEKVLEDPFDVLTTLHGTELAYVDGGDKTNIPISKHNSDPRLHQHDMLFIDLTKEAIKSCSLYYCGGLSVHDNFSYLEKWYGFPCISEDQEITHFFSILRRSKMNKVSEFL